MIRLDDEDAARSVKMSHVEILEVGGEQMRSRVSFYPQPQVIDAGLRGQRDAPEDIYGKRADWKSGKKIVGFLKGLINGVLDRNNNKNIRYLTTTL